jgi:hypothetical protein
MSCSGLKITVGLAVLIIGRVLTPPTGALADEGGVSFWIPGFLSVALRTRLRQNTTGLWPAACPISDIENWRSRDWSRKNRPPVENVRFSSPETPPLASNPREGRRFSKRRKTLGRNRDGWLG